MRLNRSEIYDNLSGLADAGVPLVKALRIVAKGNARLEKAFSNLAAAVEAGDSISAAMRRDSKHFPDLDIHLLEVGEHSGRLPEVLRSLASWYNFKQRISKAFLAHLAYPLFLLHAAFFILNVPPLILGKITTAEYLGAVFRPLGAIYLVVFAAAMLYRLGTGRGKIRLLLDSILLRVPILGRALRNLALARYTSIFKSLYGAGVPMLECASLSSKACGNAAIAAKLDGGTRSVSALGTVCQGFPLSLPGKFRAIWATGEESGTLSEALAKLSEMYMSSAEFILTQLSRWLPRIIYAGVTGYIAYRILLEGSTALTSLYGGIGS